MKYQPHIFILLLLLYGCRPELPVTSSITVYMENDATASQGAHLYGLCIAPAADEAGLLAESVRNTDFDMGEDVPGWKPISANTYIKISSSRPLSINNPYSLMVSVGGYGIRGGVIADGDESIPLKRGERYNLSFFMRTSTTVEPLPVRVALEDSTADRLLSIPVEFTPTYGWVRYSHTFTATGDAPKVFPVFSSVEANLFFLDKVSLMPENTWNNHGLRAGIMEKIDSLSPAFILYKREVGEDRDESDIYRQMSQDLKAEFISDIGSLTEKSYYAGEKYLIESPSFPDTAQAAVNRVFITGLACVDKERRSTLQAAVAEASFILRAGSNPQFSGKIAFAPIVGNYAAPEIYPPLLYFTGHTSFGTPSYYMLKMLAQNRGDIILKSDVNTYKRPQVEEAAPAFEYIDGSIEAENMRLHKSNRADSLYNYEITVAIRQAEKSGKARIQISPSVFMTIDESESLLYRQTGYMRDTLSYSPISLKEEAQIRINCLYDHLQCFIDDTLVHQVTFPPIPTLTAAAAFDKKENVIILKVVNSGLHDETTKININGAIVDSRAVIIQMKGDPECRNTPESPVQIVPVESAFAFSRSQVCKFPPNSITIIKLKAEQ